MRLDNSLVGAAVGVLVLICGISGARNAMAADFREAFDMNLRQFAGDWYEFARTPNKFEDNTLKHRGEKFGPCYNATAEYTIEDPGKLRIVNKCLRRSGQGTVIKDDAQGVALVDENGGGRKLEVAFGSGVARAFQRLLTGGGADYWIYCLGPVNEAGLDDWAVVSGPAKDFLFLMTREKSVSEELKEKMLACARREGLPVRDLIYRQK